MDQLSTFLKKSFVLLVLGLPGRLSSSADHSTSLET
jgi:hypothetical protein